MNGVGKTVTGIGLDMAVREDRPDLAELPTLIVPEKIGIDIWDHHLRAMGVPADQILMVNPQDRSAFEEALENLKKYQTTGGRKVVTYFPYKYMIAHYEAVMRMKTLVGEPGKRPTIEFLHVIADEVHLIKNRKALRTKAMKRIKCLYKTGLSGTPADDKPEDLWSVLNWLWPKKYRSYWGFYKTYVDYEVVQPYGYHKAIGVKNMDKLHKEIQPFYIRRLLTDVAKNMPEKIHVRPITMVKLSTSQRRAYEQMKTKMIAKIGDNFTLTSPAMIGVYTRLQQMALGTLVPEWDVADDYSALLDDEWEEPHIVIDRPSPKLDALMNIIETHEEEPFVVFSQFRGMVDLIEDECKSRGISVVKITGAVIKKEDRTRLVQEFQDGKARVFVGTIAAAGKGITLTRANHVIFTDRSWNPSKNEQAEDRLWRRTQTNTVRVIDIQAEDSIDQLRLETINRKAANIYALLNPAKDDA